MVKRYLLALLLVWTGIMVAAAPVAAMAMSDSVYCAKVMNSQVTETHPTGHMAHGSHGMSADEEQPTSKQDVTQPICCDHACISDAAVTPKWQGHPMHESRAIAAWTSIGRNDLTEPTGLRRPPKG